MTTPSRTTAGHGAAGSTKHGWRQPISCSTATTTTPSGAGRCGRDALFERISLEAFQSGLSWLTILRKRDNFRRAFAGFDAETRRPLHRPRHRTPAGRHRDRAQPREDRRHDRQRPRGADLDRTSASCCGRSHRRRGPVRPTCRDVPAVTPESTAMAKELKRRGFRFVGPTTAYALMQATGMVDDHVADCWVPVIDHAPS